MNGVKSQLTSLIPRRADTCPAVGAVTMETFQRSKTEHKNKQMDCRLSANDKLSWFCF